MKLELQSLKITEDLYAQFESIVENERYGFFKLIDHKNHIEESKKLYEQFKHKTHFVQIGIGGSALGPQMLIDALGKSETHFTFLDNTDPEDTFDKLKKVDMKNALFYVVSKSGGTAETVANFTICYNSLLQRGIRKEELKDYFVFCTDPKSGELRELVQDKNFHALEVPSNIGGRFSVLTSVGLFPALFAGINIENLYEGAAKLKESIQKQKNESDLIRMASKIHSLYKLGINQTILMPYSSKLKSISHWFVQLWGESLGKIDKDGNNVGLTPIPAFGATDQHSQMQLFMEGPKDKLIILLNVLNKKSDFQLKSDLNLNAANKLNQYKLSELISAQLKGTLKALNDKKREVTLIEIDRNDEFAMGELILFFESLTALVGVMINVNPFDQPGVELGKKYAFEYLNS